MGKPRQRRTAGLALVGLSVALLLTGCGNPPERQATPPEAAGHAGGSKREPARVRVVALGDSLTAGYGLEVEQAYPALLERRLRAAGLDVQVVNAGVSGDTSAGGLSRLDWSLDGDVRVLIVALGGNDALRGLGVEQLKTNLSTIIRRAQAKKLEVVLAGMEAPPNLGTAHTSAFRAVYRDVASEYGVAFLPFLLEGVAGVAHLNQQDGIHPNAAGTERVADNLWPLVEAAVRKALQP